MKAVFTFRDAIFENYQNAVLYNFLVLDALDVSDEKVVMELIKTDVFNKPNILLPSVPAWHSKITWNGFSQPAFDFALLDSSYFEQLNRAQLYRCLDNCTNRVEWSELQVNSFIYQVEWIKTEIDKCFSDSFFVISIDWFDESGRFVKRATDNLLSTKLSWNTAEYDPVLNQNAFIYGYYIMLFWVDREHSIVTVCELSWD